MSNHKFFLLIFLCLFYAQDLIARQDRPPNIILILMDDLGWKDLGCTGSNYYQTPTIDKFASEGLLFTNAYSAAPVCSPSRGAILSGKHPARTKFTAVFSTNEATDDILFLVAKPGESAMHRYNRVLNGLHYHALPKHEKTIGEYLQGLDYYTGYLGKWHAGSYSGYTPDQRGFDFAEAYRTEMVGTGAHGHWAGPLSQYSPGLDNYPDSAYLTDVITDKAVEFVKNHKHHPFFLFISHYAVHTPLQAKKDKIEKYEKMRGDDQDNPTYAAMIESMDESVGSILSAIKTERIDNNTIIIFTSDNGGLTPYSTSNYPLLGGKSFAFEAGTRVPMIIRWPATLKGGQRSAQRVIGTDLLPTIYELAGGDPSQIDTDGVSLLPVIQGSQLVDRSLFFHYPHYTSFTSPYSSVIKNDWKLIKFYNNPELPYMLFNLIKDPYEKNDLSSQEPQRLKEMTNILNQLLNDTKAEYPLKNSNYKVMGPGINDRYTTYQKALDIWNQMKQKED